MSEIKNDRQAILEQQLKALIAEEKATQQAARSIAAGEMKFELDRDDLVKGIILREVLGPPKALEG